MPEIAKSPKAAIKHAVRQLMQDSIFSPTVFLGPAVDGCRKRRNMAVTFAQPLASAFLCTVGVANGVGKCKPNTKKAARKARPQAATVVIIDQVICTLLSIATTATRTVRGCQRTAHPKTRAGVASPDASGRARQAVEREPFCLPPFRRMMGLGG
jgi:hypothetical protein